MNKMVGHRVLAMVVILVLLSSTLPGERAVAADSASDTAEAAGWRPGRVITANVVALNQEIVYNRLGTINPVGMIYALRRDVVHKNRGRDLDGKTEAETPGHALMPGKVGLRADKRPRPLTLRMNVDDTLVINFQNLLNPEPLHRHGPFGGEADQPKTRNTGLHVTGMQLVDSISDDGSNVGRNESSLVKPGGSTTYRILAEREGTYMVESPVDNVSLEGIGTRAFGLFGAVNVEPKGSVWYRSQVTQAEMALATARTSPSGHPVINYAAVYPKGHRYAGLPVLNILDGDEIVHSDLTAIIVPRARTYTPNPAYPDRDQPFREFTIVFHDEIKAIQSFALFEDPAFTDTLHSVRDATAINYGSTGAGAEIVANRLGVGPMWDSVESKFEEMFLSSWVIGDPAQVVDIPANSPDWANPDPGPKATKALYPEDPSNVYHSYLNDHVKFRNLSIGKEHHIFHLHAEQWLFTPDDDNSTYLDSQAIGPGSGYTYEIAYGGSGNRNKTVGDAIFHCHFYPHFAQGMWSLWRIHDTFEAGTVLDADGRPAHGSRALPDGEIEAGTPIPAMVPLPSRPMAPLPGNVAIVPGSTMKPPLPGGQVSITEPDANGDGKPDRNVGFPFFVPGVAGHMPPTPPLDIVDDGGLPRYVIIGGTATKTVTPLNFSAVLDTVIAQFLPEGGTAAEKAAMDFHARRFYDTYTPEGKRAAGSSGFETNGLPPVRGAPFADPGRTDAGKALPTNRVYRGADIQLDMVLNKSGWHFPQSRIVTLWGDVLDTLAGNRPPEPFVMRVNSGDVIDFFHTNMVPMDYEQDAFQVRTPTDVIGQHIHLVKFDILGSDGGGNGYNYDDDTMSPDGVREIIDAIQAPGGDAIGLPPGQTRESLAPEPHPFFGATGPNGEDWRGARTTVQRWYADPLVNRSGRDRTLGTVFTHDHMGPSSHQQAGLYGTLLVEPRLSQWRDPETGVTFGGEKVTPRTIAKGLTDGGPTSWRADIIVAEDRIPRTVTNNHDKASFREFFLEFQDFQLAYEHGRGGTLTKPIPDPAGAINPPGTKEVGLPKLFAKPEAFAKPNAPGKPEAISAADVGTFTVNYRNEPIALRVRDPHTKRQAEGAAGDLSLAFASNITRADPDLNVQPDFYPPLTADVRPGDPFTPLLRVFEGDRVRIRTQVGATEEGHNVSIHGMKWLQEFASPNSGWRNSQMMGISEQFSFDVTVNPLLTGGSADYLYMVGSSVDDLWNGNWGIMRAYRGKRDDLKPLPSNPQAGAGLVVRNAKAFDGVVPRGVPTKQYDITAVLAKDVLPGGSLVYNPRGATLQDPTAILYVRTQDLVLDTSGKPAGLKEGVPVEPLILRANAGDRIEVTLRNKLPHVLPDLPGFNALPPIITGVEGIDADHGFNANDVRPSNRVGLHPQLVAYDVTTSDGATVGFNDDQTVAPGEMRKYTWYAGDVTYNMVTKTLRASPVEFGATGLISSDRIKHSNKGAVGALIIEPTGTTWTEDAGTRASATVTYKNNGRVTSFREFVLVLQDDLNLRRGHGDGTPLPFIGGEEDSEDSGNKAVNYRAEPLWFRLGIEPGAPEGVIGKFDFTNALDNDLVGGDPVTPVFTARAGDSIRFRVLDPAGHGRNQVFGLHGHIWQREPYENGSSRIGNNPFSQWKGSQEGLGPTGHWDFVPVNGAGGKNRVRGDYLYRDISTENFYQGVWGILRVK